MRSNLGAKQIAKIVKKHKEHGIAPLSNSDRIVYDCDRGQPKKKRDAMQYFQRETSYYKHHQGLISKYKISLQ